MSDTRLTPQPKYTDAPPCDKDAEQYIISAILKDQDCFTELNGYLKAEDFYYECHQILFRIVEQLTEKGIIPDLVTVASQLTKAQYENIGGYGYLADLWIVAPTAANSPVYAKIIREHADRRKLIYLASRIIRDAFGGKRPVNEILEEISISLDSVERVMDHNAIVHISECIEEEKNRIDHSMKSIEPDLNEQPIRTGLDDIDRLMGGFRPGSVTVVGARPGIGKSSFGIQLLDSAARQKVPSLFTSLEMSRSEIIARQIAGVVPIDLKRLLEAKRITPEEVRRVIDATNEMKDFPIWYCDTFNMSVSDLTAIVRTAVRKHGIKLLVIDYLQLINPELRGVLRTEQIADMTRRIKLLAKQYKLAIVLMSQLNRESARDESKPKLSDLRESGAIEQDADNVILLWSERNTEKNELTMSVNCSVAKQRHGPTAELQLVFRRPITRFENHYVSR